MRREELHLLLPNADDDGGALKRADPIGIGGPAAAEGIGGPVAVEGNDDALIAGA